MSNKTLDLKNMVITYLPEPGKGYRLSEEQIAEINQAIDTAVAEAVKQLQLYKLLFGEIQDPYGKVDTLKALQSFKENESFHQNFGRYMELLKSELSEGQEKEGEQ